MKNVNEKKSDFKRLLNEVCTIINNKEGNETDKFSSIRRDLILNPKYKNQNTKLKYSLLFNKFNHDKSSLFRNNLYNKIGNVFIDTMKPPKTNDINDTKNAIKDFLQCIKSPKRTVSYCKNCLFNKKYKKSLNNSNDSTLNQSKKSKIKTRLYYLMNYYGYDNENNKKRKVDGFSTEKKNNNHKRRSIEIFKKELSYFLNKNFFPSSNTNNEQKSIDISTNDSSKNSSSFYKIKTLSKSLSHLELKSIESQKQLQKSQEDLKKIEKDIQDNYIRYFMKYGKIKKSSYSKNFK
jgi:chaperonin cofactor prefoldin